MKICQKILDNREEALHDESLIAAATKFLSKEILEKAILKGEFMLSSGKRSDYYLDLRVITLSGVTDFVVGYLFLANLIPWVKAVGGPVIGADPIVGSIISIAPIFGRKIDGFLVRKEAKAHGTKSFIEGPIKPPLDVCVVEDVITTGTSIFNAVDKLKESGFNVIQALALVDREEEDVKERFDSLGISYKPIFRVSELL